MGLVRYLKSLAAEEPRRTCTAVQGYRNALKRGANCFQIKVFGISATQQQTVIISLDNINSSVLCGLEPQCSKCSLVDFKGADVMQKWHHIRGNYTRRPPL
jgi:hypothetical protein